MNYQHTNEDEVANPFLPPKKKAGRKKVSRRKKVKHVKERGRYGNMSSVIGGDGDLADSLFCDDEVCIDTIITALTVTSRMDIQCVSLIIDSERVSGNPTYHFDKLI